MELALTQGRVVLVDDEDHEWASQFSWHVSDETVGVGQRMPDDLHLSVSLSSSAHGGQHITEVRQ